MASPTLLLLSNSKNTGGAYLEHAREPLDRLFGSRCQTIAFLPFAAVRFSFDAYERMVADALSGFEIRSLHRAGNPGDLLFEADAIAVGGGNTFCLLDAMQQLDLMGPITERVASGIPYVGWSAGSNVACPTIRTTNDMPIVEPRTFEALGLVSFQINPHFLDAHPDGHMGETREERIEEFVCKNPGIPVLGLREGAWLEQVGDSLTLGGANGGRFMTDGDIPRELSSGSDLSFLLERKAG